MTDMTRAITAPQIWLFSGQGNASSYDEGA
jgi:hypothetical protein